ncbi:amidohydrolase family protein [Prolixibacteraceae bacterium Z1-6]|uniref:Amidohydrolase family protein n=1 Tax=Draconibacterium aestuarii TaxID=2998507 RepID=A0A9X3J6S2_9BACT|nr:amidohydrolase family protein [Prolixibacteraceae bacterium Z1-6]
MRKIAATYIFPVSGAPIKNGILVCNDDGTIVEVIDRGENFREEAGVEFYSGILVPGFVNVHCHLEFSHLKDKIPEKTGLSGFIGKINQLRDDDENTREKSIQIADKTMWAAGTAAVGDISNSVRTVGTKLKSKIHYHTFVESFGFHPSRAEKSFSYSANVLTEFQKNKLSASIVPHSPYSVSEPLFTKIMQKAETEQSIITIHNQESRAENVFFKKGGGPIAGHLQNNLGIDISHWQPSGKSSLQSILKYIPTANKLLLVHNTFTQEEDLEVLKQNRAKENTCFVLCPNANLYIEDQLPPVQLFRNHKLNICLGTDSLASNHQLSVLHEMITLQLHFPELELSELISWATINGAKALGVENRYGSFESGQIPGVNLLTGINFRQMKLTSNSKVKRLL